MDSEPGLAPESSPNLIRRYRDSPNHALKQDRTELPNRLQPFVLLQVCSSSSKLLLQSVHSGRNLLGICCNLSSFSAKDIIITTITTLQERLEGERSHKIITPDEIWIYTFEAVSGFVRFLVSHIFNLSAPCPYIFNRSFV